MSLSAETILFNFLKRIGVRYSHSRNLYSFVYQGNIEVFLALDETPNRLRVYAYLRELPKKGNAQFYQQLLEDHFFGIKTSGASFGISKELNQVIFYQVMNADCLTDNDFLLALIDFVKAFSVWQKKLKEKTVLVD